MRFITPGGHLLPFLAVLTFEIVQIMIVRHFCHLEILPGLFPLALAKIMLMQRVLLLYNASSHNRYLKVWRQCDYGSWV